MRALLMFALAVSLAACAHFRAVCPAGTQGMWRAELLMGRNVGGELGVSESDWARFVAAEITPRFPNGFTVTDAAGQWRGDNGVTISEPSKVVTVIAPPDGDTRTRLDAIAGAYKVRFHQDAVGIVVAPACASF